MAGWVVVLEELKLGLKLDWEQLVIWIVTVGWEVAADNDAQPID